MKKLIKLKINQEKVMKDVELKTISGGYGTCYGCYDCEGGLIGTVYGAGLSDEEALDVCNSFYHDICFAFKGQCA